jgi:hypothetical protein
MTALRAAIAGHLIASHVAITLAFCDTFTMLDRPLESPVVPIPAPTPTA